jgi:bifunctional DNA-binding transcriptional regulator/antitoxin component of YhaV-PrlF toxin-antitoxin module
MRVRSPAMATTATAKITSKGQLTLPRSVRELRGHE